jgi:hypothetical protein
VPHRHLFALEPARGFPGHAAHPEMRERNRAIATMCSRFEPVLYEVTSVY